MTLFKRILGNDERKRHRWVSGHLELGKRKAREREILEELTAFRDNLARRGIGYREERDAWEAYLDEDSSKYLRFVGGDVNEVLREKAYQVFCGYWRRINRAAIVRFEGDGVVSHAPTLLTIGKGDERVRANPIDLLRVTDPEKRALGANKLIRTIERREKASETFDKHTAYLKRLVDGLQGNAIAVTDPNTGEIIVQGLLGEGISDDDE